MRRLARFSQRVDRLADSIGTARILPIPMPYIVLNLTYTPGSPTHKPTTRYMQFGE